MSETYVKWGNHASIEKILQKGVFYPLMIFGPSGTGKTFMVEENARLQGRTCVRVQITPETDEDDLIGGLRLKDGDTVFQEGPVLQCMRNGHILLLDEMDRGTNKLMCLQSVVEGKSVLVKKTGEVVHPAPGFTVLATANTAGQGDEDGRYSAAQIIDEAFLERFYGTVYQGFPPPDVEHIIVKNHFSMDSNISEQDQNTVCKFLCIWAQEIRKGFQKGVINDVISTRRLCQIAKTFEILEDIDQSIELCIGRFPEESKDAFKQFLSTLIPKNNQDEGDGEQGPEWARKILKE